MTVQSECYTRTLFVASTIKCNIRVNTIRKKVKQANNNYLPGISKYYCSYPLSSK